MKTTTTLLEMIHSELIKNNHNEFVNNNRLTFMNDEFSFIKKIMNMDNDVLEIINTMFFQGCELSNVVIDRHFKRTFMSRFLNREIAYQTVEAFSAQVVYTFLIYEDYLEVLYDDLDDYVHGKQSTESDDNGTDISDNRFLSTELPQSKVNLNVDDTVLEYGDNNTISRNKSEKTGTANSQSKSYSLDELLKTRSLLDEVFNDFDSNCFLQTW